MTTPPLPPPILSNPQFEYLTQFVNVRTGSIILGGRVNLDSLNEVLNSHAQQGWRLASTFVATSAADAAHQVVLIFERPKS